jgi:hypothetical protein
MGSLVLGFGTGLSLGSFVLGFGMGLSLGNTVLGFGTGLHGLTPSGMFGAFLVGLPEFLSI